MREDLYSYIRMECKVVKFNGTDKVYIYLASVLRLIYFLKTSSKSFTIGKESHCSKYNSFQLRQRRATYMDNGQN